jgi:transcriptional regulator with XRE-family HTH domain
MLPSEQNYLRFHRKISGLSLRELADVIGLTKEEQISLHEQSREMPLLITALGYEIAFQVPASRLFPGLYESVRNEVESRLTTLRDRLQGNAARGHSATMVARKLRWLRARRDEVQESSSFAK